MKSIFVIISIAILGISNPAFSQKTIEKKAKKAAGDMKTDLVDELRYTSNFDSNYTSRSMYLYDDQGNINLIQQFPFDGFTTGKKLLYKEEYIYNEKKLLTEHSIYYIDYDLNLGDTLLPVTKYKYEYDGNNNLILKYFFSWDIEGASWHADPNVKDEYVYDSTNQLKHLNSFMYYESNWIPVTTIDYVFDSAHNALNVFTNMYYNYKSEWDKSDSVVYFLNEDSLCIAEEKYIYNSTDSSWNIFMSSETEYNSSGSIIFNVTGNYFAKYYTPMTKSEYAYENNDLLLTVLSYTWKIDMEDTINKGSFILSAKDDYMHADNGQLKFLLNSTWSEDQQQWNKNYAYEYKYDFKVNTLDELFNDGILLYPNPASENLYIKNLPAGSLINIFNSNGMKVITSESDAEIISVNNLSSGIYYIEVSRNNMRLLNQVFIKY